MRAGACTIQQALTGEAASILKHSLNLARRRGHAQVTPLHVAATLLNSSYSSSSLLRRACIRSHPQHPSSLPLQCRALELCFNVALHRLPSSSSSLLHSHPSLSNALIAALKRAQAHQRRGCIEHSHQTNQTLLPIQIQIQQLIISILDDPSVSRVMREAGFSSTSVKHNLEDDSSVLLPTVEKKEDVRLVLEVMMRRKQRQGKGCGNAVVVGDSDSMAEGVVDELLEELRGAEVIKLQLTYVHIRVMSKVDVEMKVSDLRRRVFSCLEKGVVVYAGDLRWAVGDEGRAWESFAVEYLISEVGRIVSEIKNGVDGVGGERGRVWVLAFCSYKTYMRCKMINPLLESLWDLQAVFVPSGGLALSLQAPCSMDSVVSKLKQSHLQMLDPRDSNGEEEEEKFLCCAECFSNYEKEVASVLKSEAKDAINGNNKLPCWLQSEMPEKPHKTNFLELRKKWMRLCQNLHQSRISIAQAHPSFISKAYASSHPWPPNSLPSTNSLLTIEPSPMSFPTHNKKSTKQWPSESNPKSSKKLIITTLALCNPLCSDSATSNDHIKPSPLSPRGLTQKIQENIPWQSEHIHLVVDALLDCRLTEKKEIYIVIHGNDRIAKNRLVRLVAHSFFGSTETVLHINMKKSTIPAIDQIKAALVKEPKNVVLIDDIDSTAPEFVNLIQNGFKDGFFKDLYERKVGLPSLIFILTSSATVEGYGYDKVIRMRMWTDGEEEHQQQSNEKRKSEWNQTREKKQPRTANGDELDLNVAITSNDEDNDDCGQLPATTVLNFDINNDVFDQIVERLTARLQRAFEEVVAGNRGKETLVVDPALAEELAMASGYFLEFEFDKWVREVFQNCIPTVKKGGKVRLGMEGRVENRLELGFLSSTLPMNISVD